MKLTVLIRQGSDYLIGTIQEIPAVITQGKDKAEVMANIHDALTLYLEDMPSEDDDYGAIIAKEELILA
ncbi:hypothetical protein GCM10027275_45660 [Rhabdobacter roseus]|uniref:Putative RNase H-like HicB family nuclease n=1 Tax=Rhabdobacter roseus TaxID=1655419 RepID=A0A840TR11_9BACT|nr:type II toxin-antitoxin system HicB family antitoxin [Rhabdobacter roseus]MBB5286766.1 putative RNase H-like HicB family nuclease [Rhabdobacter roseus]